MNPSKPIANTSNGACGPGFTRRGPNIADGAVVVTVRVVVAVPSAAGVTLVGLTLQVASDGAPEQEKLTALVNPPVDATVNVDVTVPPTDTTRLAGVLLTENPGGAVTVTTTGEETDPAKLESPP
jgi:hypothetical protein